jgi:RNA polymerase sigma factor (sigma-70 family)
MNERHQDFELLQQFVRHGQQDTFTAVVRRHLDLVCGTAMRKVEEQGAAEEVAQNVFAALARKAWRFAPDDSLPAWLHRTTLLESKAWLRGELRRRRREQTAVQLGTTMKEPDNQPSLRALLPLLDEALLSLREKDRAALLLRYYESRSLREVGVALGVKEDAAQKRVASALQQLTSFFKRHGFKTATAALAASALQQTATSAPAVTATAIVQATAQVAPPTLAGLAPLLTRLASMGKLQTASLCGLLVMASITAQWYQLHTAEKE